MIRLALISSFLMLTLTLPASAQVVTYGIGFVGFNTTQPPFADPALRRVVALVTPRAQLFQGEPGVTPADGIVPRRCYGAGVPRLSPYDIEAAKQLLESRSVKPSELPELGFWTEGDPSRADPLLRELRALGFRVAVRTDGSFSAVRSPAVNLFYISLLTNACTEARAEAILAVGFRSVLDSLVGSKGSLNIFGYSNPDVDAQIARARTLVDRPRSVDELFSGIRIFEEVQQKVLDDAVLIPIW
jgi:ABC-type transport system substrate-binding protein